MESKGEYRYPGSRPFEDTDIDRMLFFGREREKEELLQKIIARKLVVLHAESGLGKTSLLNAGVSGLLKDRGFLPIKIRFNFAVISPIQAVFSGIEETRARQSLDVEAGETETLWHYFKTAAFWSADDSLLTPVLILDQFEEFFTFHEPEVRNEFISQLADLVHNTIPSALRQVIRAGELYRYGEEPPRVKIVISIRGDFLGQLDELSSAIPEILENRYRLSPLSRSQAREAITRPAQLEDEQMLTRRFRYSEDALNMMLDYLSKRQERGGVVNKDEIESFQLQLLCRHIETNILEKASKASGQDEFVIKKEDLGGEAGIHKVFQYFYEDRLTGLKSARDKRHVRRMCEKGLISDSDRRLSLEEEVIEKQFKVSSTLLAQLVDNRLLRAEKRVGSVYYELSHDTLIKPIRLSQRNPMDTLFKEAENFAFEYDFDKAIEKYNIILKKDPKNKKAIVKLGELLMRSRKYKDSIKLYKKAIANEITDARVYAGLWKAFFKIRKDDQAIKYLKEAIKCNPGQADAYEALGDYYADKKDFKIAIENYEEVLAIDDKYRAVYEKLAVLYGEIGEKEKAIDVFKRAIKVDVEFAEIYQEIRDVLKKKNDMKTLETLCGLALQVKSKDVNYFYWLGYDYHELKKYDTSIEICRKALELKPDDAYVYNLMGVAQNDKGDYDAAISSYRKALELKPDDAGAYCYMGVAQSNKDDYDAAISSFLKALELKPDFAEAYCNMGFAQSDKGDYDAAISSSRKALELKPDLAEAYRSMGYVLTDKGDYDAALESYQKALELNPNYVEAYNDMGYIFNKKGDYEGAIASCQKALQLKSDYANPCVHIGVAQKNIGDYDCALASFQKALEIKPTYLSAKVNLSDLYLITERFNQSLELLHQLLKEKDVRQHQSLAMKSIAISSLFFQGNKAEALMELQQLITYYRDLTNDFKRDWDYCSIKKFITHTQRLNEPTRLLLLKMIDLLEAPKKEGDKILVELEIMVREFK